MAKQIISDGLWYMGLANFIYGYNIILYNKHIVQDISNDWREENIDCLTIS